MTLAQAIETEEEIRSSEMEEQVSRRIQMGFANLN